MTALARAMPKDALSWELGSGRAGWVSVIVPAFNRETLIVETLESVRAQTYRPIELIVVDDGSVDSTAQIAEYWAADLPVDEQFLVRILRQENSGAAAARNRGVAGSTGEFIQFLDSDDVLETRKIELQVQALNGDISSDFAYGPVARLEQPDKVVYCQSEMSPRRMILKQLTVPTFTTLGPLLRRTMVQRTGRWNPTLPICQDWEYYSRALVLGCEGVYVPDAYSYIRTHEGHRLSESSALDEVVYGRFAQIDSMLEYAPGPLRNDRGFAATAAWQLLIVTARFVAMGWPGDEGYRYHQAKEVACGLSLRIVTTTLIGLTWLLGRRASARVFLALPWIYYRVAGLKARFDM